MRKFRRTNGKAICLWSDSARVCDPTQNAQICLRARGRARSERDMGCPPLKLKDCTRICVKETSLHFWLLIFKTEIHILGLLVLASGHIAACWICVTQLGPLQSNCQNPLGPYQSSSHQPLGLDVCNLLLFLFLPSRPAAEAPYRGPSTGKDSSRGLPQRS